MIPKVVSILLFNLQLNQCVSSIFQAIYMDFKKIALLFIFFIFYVTIGGIIFMMLEAPLEQTMRSEIEKVLHDFRGEIIYHFIQ